MLCLSNIRTHLEALVLISGYTAIYEKSFPSTVTAETIKKLGIAPNNEGYLINTLKFIGVIDNDGNKSKEASSVFSKHEDEDFAKDFGKLVRSAYSDLFSLHSEESWTLDQSKLISFFRASDESSAVVGQRQATTFQALAALSGYGELPTTKSSGKKATIKAEKPKTNEKVKPQKAISATPSSTVKPEKSPVYTERKNRDLGLTVRIEINLPAVADQATYDMIFKSIRENLINVE